MKQESLPKEPTTSSFVGNQTGSSSGVNISNIVDYNFITIIATYTIASDNVRTWTCTLPKAFLSGLGNNYRFVRLGDKYSVIIIGVTSNIVILNTAMFIETDISSDTTIYVYKS